MLPSHSAPSQSSESPEAGTATERETGNVDGPIGTKPALLTRGLRIVALYEVAKGLLALAAAAILSAWHQPAVRHFARVTLERLHLPHLHEGHSLLGWIHDGLAQSRVLLIVMACLYAMIRFAEGYGLWWQQRWAEWLAAVSVALWLPVEIWKLLRQPGWVPLVIFLANVAVLALVVRALQLSHARRAQRGEMPPS